MKKIIDFFAKVFLVFGIAFIVIGGVYVNKMNNYDLSIHDLSVERVENQSELDKLVDSKDKLNIKELDSIENLKEKLVKIDKQILGIEKEKNNLSTWIGFLTPLSIGMALIIFGISLFLMDKTTSLNDNQQKKNYTIIRFWHSLKVNSLKIWSKLKDDYNLGYLLVLVAIVILVVGSLVTLSSYLISIELIETSQISKNVEELQFQKERSTFLFNLLTIAGLVATVASIGFTYIRNSPKGLDNEKSNRKSV